MNDDRALWAKIEGELRTWPHDEVAPENATPGELALHMLLWGSVCFHYPKDPPCAAP